MRRKDRQVLESDKIDEIINNCNCCRIGLYDSENNEVYIVPLNFGFINDNGNRVFYFHSAKEGRKIDLIKKCGNVGFELDTNYKTIGGEMAKDYTAQYQSVIGTGKISIVNDFKEKTVAFDALMYNVSKKRNWEIAEDLINITCIFKLEVSQITCKQNIVKA